MGALTANRKRQIYGYVVLVISNGFMEIFSIGMLIPFLGAVINPSMIFDHEVGKLALDLLKINDPESITLPITVIFIGAIILAGCLRLFSFVGWDMAIGFN